MDAGAVVYEVNLTVRQEVAAEYCDWLKHHIVEMMKIDGFLSYTWMEREEEGTEEGDALWTVQYLLSSREALEKYFQDHATVMRKEGIDKFGGKFEASRRILRIVEK